MPQDQPANHVIDLHSELRGDHQRRDSFAARIAIFALRFYKAYLSILFAGACRFEPTCSQYSLDAIKRYGVARGSWLTLQRLLRCQPLSRRFGYDPVPEISDEMRGNLRGEGTFDSAQVVDAQRNPESGMSPQKEAHS